MEIVQVSQDTFNVTKTVVETITTPDVKAQLISLNIDKERLINARDSAQQSVNQYIDQISDIDAKIASLQETFGTHIADYDARILQEQSANSEYQMIKEKAVEKSPENPA